MSDPLLSVRNLSKRFGAVQALRGVDLELAAGEIVALAGENGSGKSTLARIVAGVLEPDAGSIAFGGSERAWTGPRDALDCGIALVSQEPTSVPALSVAENVLLTRLRGPASRFRKAEVIRAAVPLLDAVGLDLDPRRAVGTLGPGQRELVEVAKALASKPRVLLLDESTARLPDPERLFRLTERLVEHEGLAVLFITHRLTEILRLAHRAVVLRDGRVAGALARDQLSERNVTALMVGRDLSGFFHRADVEPGASVLAADGIVTERAPEPLTLSIRAGEVVGLAGLVGSGRSELLETLAGLRRARAGSIDVDGRELRPGSPAAAIRGGIALLPEDRHAQGLILDAPVRANVAMASWRPLSLVRRASERERAAAAVDRLGIRCSGIDAPVRSLSGGNQQKVVFARCLERTPRVLLLDEPTRGVDVGAREEIYRIVGDLAARGTGILVASSELPELLGLCDRILVLADGRLAGALTRAEATEARIMMLAAQGSEAQGSGAQGSEAGHAA